RWLRAQRFDNPALQLTFEAAFDAMLACRDRRTRLDAAITAMAADSEFTPVVHRLGCIRGIATLTAFGLAVEVGAWHRLTGRSIGAYVGLVPCEYSSGDSRSQGGVTKTGTDTLADCWSKPPGITAAPTGPASSYGAAGVWPVRLPGHAVRPQIGVCTPAGGRSTPARNVRWSPTWRSPGNWPAGAGHWRSCPTDPPTIVQMNNADAAASVLE